LREGKVALQFFALYIGAEYKPLAPLQRTLELADVFYGELVKNAHQMELIREYSDIGRILDNGKLAALLTVEGGECIQESL
jgi:membrane dipeptidase